MLFPSLPSYVAFIQRVNKLGDAFVAMIESLQQQLPQALFANDHHRLIDSMPILMAQRGRRFSAKVTPEIADKGGYCATKKLYYYGVKLHILGSAQPGTLPIPDKIGIIPAGMSDIRAYKAILPEIMEYDKFADKAYMSEDTEYTKTYTPVKRENSDCE